MRSRHSIFRKENIVLRLLRDDIDLLCALKRDDPDFIGILESYR